MADYIEKSQLKNSIKRYFKHLIENDKYKIDVLDANADIHKIISQLPSIERLPAADVAEVKHGKWEFKNNGAYGRTRCYCTACGKHSGIGGIRENQLKPYCPNCGAKMDGEREDKE